MENETYTLPDKPEYHSAIRRLQNTDPGHAETTFNPLIQQILENTEFVRLLVQALADRMAADHTAIRQETAQSIQSAVESVPLAIDAHNDSANAHSEQFAGKVPAARKINGKPLSQDITLSASDVGAAASSHTHTAAQVGAAAANHTHTAAQVGALSTGGGALTGPVTTTGTIKIGSMRLAWNAAAQALEFEVV